jgi:phosphoribosylformylglycinamidine synthase
MKATVTVVLKEAVLDPQGKAIQHSLNTLGFSAVEDVRAGKVFRITLKDNGAPSDQIEKQLREMCEKLLANPITETFSYTIEA